MGGATGWSDLGEFNENIRLSAQKTLKSALAAIFKGQKEAVKEFEGTKKADRPRAATKSSLTATFSPTKNAT